MGKHADIAAIEDRNAGRERRLEARALVRNRLGLRLLPLFPSRVLRRRIAGRERRTERKQRPTRKAKLRFDAWEFVYPFLFSAITFGVVLSATEQTPLGFASGLLSFQNGFFWKTMLARQIAIVGEEKSES